ncbi:DnaB-like replicative helicase [Vibrio phage VB_VaC_TDDLMA]
MQEFESILLKKMTHNAEFFGKVVPIVHPKYFQDTGNQELMKLVQEHYNQYRKIPTLTELVASVKNVSNAEIRAAIVDSLKAVSATEEVANMEFMCDETVSWVKDAMYMESLRIGSDGLMKKDDGLKQKAKKIMEDMAKVTIDSDLGLDFDDIETMIEYYSNRMLGIKTQHKELNKRLGPGFLPKTLSVILAASGIGKSLLMTDLISGMIKNNKNVLLISLEMADKEIMKRVHANALDLPINSFVDLAKTSGEINELDRPALTKEMVQDAYTKIKTSGTCGKFFVKDYPAGGFSALMLENLVESYKLEKDIEFDIIFIDYLGIMKSDLVSPSAGLYSYIKSIGEEVRASAKKLDLPIVSASQLNRGATNNTEDADNSNVSDSMGTVMTADFMLFLLQNEEMKERKEIVCKITKNRFAGITDTWMMNIDYEHMRFNDMIVQTAMSDLELTDTLGLSDDANKIDDDFGIITKQKQQDAEKFANQEVKDIALEDIEKVKKADSEKEDPFNNDLDDLYAELGL